MAFETLSHGNLESIALAHETIGIRGAEQPALAEQSLSEIGVARIALTRHVRAASVAALNQILADAMTLRDLYKKHHWQTSGPTFYQLHLLFDKHYEEQVTLIDAIAERVQTLGGTAIAMAADVAVTTMLRLSPMDCELPAQQLARLSDAHESVLYYARAAARRSADMGDDGTNDLLVSQVIRTNEKQAWFVQQQSQGNPD